MNTPFRFALRPFRLRWRHGIVLAALGAGGCDSDPTGPGQPAATEVFVLNSTGQTLAAFAVADGLTATDAPVDLGAGFDGDAIAVSPSHVAATVSSFGGSLVVLVDRMTGSVITASFPSPEADQANPSKPSFDSSGLVWLGGRGSDSVYRLRPGDAMAERIASDVGSFVERVVPFGDLLYAIDANIDDAGGTFRPLGPGRVIVLGRDGRVQSVLDLPPGSLNPTDAVATAGRLVILAAGSFDPGTFEPAGDGTLVSIRLADGSIDVVLPLFANGVSLEVGADGAVYVTTTADFNRLNVLRFDPGAGVFERGPDRPIELVDAAGSGVDCWAATAMSDGRLLCITFSFAEAGRLVLADSEGTFVDEIPSGFGSSDLDLP